MTMINMMLSALNQGRTGCRMQETSFAIGEVPHLMPVNPKILVVDDRRENQLVVASILESEGYELVFASSGEEALVHLLKQEFDLVLLDVNMPGLDGFETAETLRARKKTRQLPIIFLTANPPNDEWKEQAYLHQGVDILFKPLNAVVLRAKVDVLTKLHVRTRRLEEQARQLRANEAKLERVVEERTRELKETILQLNAEIESRQVAETKLEEYATHLEEEVRLRTADLELAVSSVRSSRDQLEAVLRSVDEGVMVLGMDFQIQSINPMARRMLGFDEKAVLGLSDKARGNSSFALLRKRMGEACRQSPAGEFVLDLEGEGFESRKVLKVGFRKVFKGASQSYVVSCADVTHFVLLTELKTDFLSTAAHELRTPLTSIRGFVELVLVRGDSLTEKQKRHYLKRVEDQSIVLGKIIDDLLDVAKIESGEGGQLELESLSPVKAVSSLVERFQETNPEMKIDLVLENEPGIIKMDELRFEQVLNNLLSNAIKFSGDSKRVEVSVTQAESVSPGVEIIVRDYGIGMDENAVSRAFEKFYRVDSQDTAISGTGLGLPIVKFIVEAHGGEVRIESEPSKGTTVTCFFPREGKPSPA